MTLSTAGPRSIAGQVAVVTGAGSGIGAATARLFAEQGAVVAALDQVAVPQRPGISEFRGDLADPGWVEAVVPQIESALGPVDILVNAAGVSARVPLSDPDFLATWERTLAVNTTAQLRLIRACLPSLTRNSAGRVVNIASTEGLGASGGLSAYTASKHAVVGLTRGLAVELGRQGVTVNAIAPGPIRTGMTAAIPDDAKQKFARRRVPLGRYGEPVEVAHMILSLVLPAASYVTGVVLPVDGGLLVQNT